MASRIFPHTFLWHDYETFGANPRRDRPAQFAAIRTDADLNQVGEALMLYCQPAPDFLPDPESCLITGITPRQCLQLGIPEAQFAAQIEQVLGQENTIGVGYNTIRFDDEITRFMLWRNLIEPYAREWQNGCGRWDLLDVVRTAYALRPEGIQWPVKPDGGPSFRLGDLAAANGLLHESAHDALSDVRATIDLARLLKQSQPRLFEFCFALHRKDRVMAELGLPGSALTLRPFWHVSGMFSAQQGCLALMWPLAMHPSNKNELLAWDLSHDPQMLADLNAEAIRLRLFTRSADLPDGISRLPLKSIHLNRSPMVFSNLRVVTEAQAERWGLNIPTQLVHAAHAQALPDMSAIWPAVFARPAAPALDVDEDLYGGFVNDRDRRRLNEFRVLEPADMAKQRVSFDDARLCELCFRYRARNFPQTLSATELEQWHGHCADRLLQGLDGARTVAQLQTEVASLRETANERDAAILRNLLDYAHVLAERLAPGFETPAT